MSQEDLDRLIEWEGACLTAIRVEFMSEARYMSRMDASLERLEIVGFPPVTRFDIVILKSGEPRTLSVPLYQWFPVPRGGHQAVGSIVFANVQECLETGRWTEFPAQP